MPSSGYVGHTYEAPSSDTDTGVPEPGAQPAHSPAPQGAGQTQAAPPVVRPRPRGKQLPLPKPYPLTGRQGKKYQKFLKENPDKEVPEEFLKLNAIDAKTWEKKHFQLRYDDDVDRICGHMSTGVQPIFAVANTKSASKTITALHVGLEISSRTGKFGIVFPATLNTGTATLGRMSGVENGRLLTVAQFNERIGDYSDYRPFSGRIPRMKDSNLGVIAEKRRGERTDGYNPWDFLHNILTILPYVDFLILDLGNDNLQTDSIGYFAARLAHALILPYKSGDPVSKDTLRDTIWALRDDTKPWVFDPTKADLSPRQIKCLYEDTGYLISTPDKVAAAIVVANIFKPGDRSTDFERLMRPDEGSDKLPTKTWTGSGTQVPADPYISRIDVSEEDTDERIPPCDLTRIMPVTDLAFMDVTADTLDVAAAAQRYVKDRSRQFRQYWESAFSNKTPDVVDPNLVSISPTPPEGDMK